MDRRTRKSIDFHITRPDMVEAQGRDEEAEAVEVRGGTRIYQTPDVISKCCGAPTEYVATGSFALYACKACKKFCSV